jgi:hypothetical protein
MEDSNTVDPIQSIETTTLSPKSKLPIVLIFIILLIFIVVGVSAYYLGTKQVKNQVDITPTQISTNENSQTLINKPTSFVVNPQFKVPLKNNWKRITITNLGFSMQIPIEWKAGYCRNKLKKEYTSLDYLDGDDLFLASNSAEFDVVECDIKYRTFIKHMYFTTKEKYESSIEHLTNREDPRKLESVIINGLNLQTIYVNWCEGKENEREFDSTCIPIVGGPSNIVSIQFPIGAKLNNYEYLEFNFLVPLEIQKTFEFY